MYYNLWQSGNGEYRLKTDYFVFHIYKSYSNVAPIDAMDGKYVIPVYEV